jgi:membrane-associated protease RseP (regulator of RpoE activity)
VNRIVLLDVGMAGPLASFVLSLPLVAVGFLFSEARSDPTMEVPSRYAVFFQGFPIWLGGSPIFDALGLIFAPQGDLLFLHPLAFAGWVGLFVTALNLFPLAQLDGGHILYSLVGNRQRYFGLAFLAILIGLGFYWRGWWLWAALILVLGKGSIRHPSVFDPEVPVRGRRKLLGWSCVFIFVLTFAAFPIRFG